MSIELDRATDEIVKRYGSNPEKILAAARIRGIITEYWNIAARELAKHFLNYGIELIIESKEELCKRQQDN